MRVYEVDANPLSVGYGDRRANGLLNRIQNLLVEFVSWLKEKRDYHAAISELYAMSDRDLADIGIVRCDIPMVVRHAYKRNPSMSRTRPRT